MINTLIKLSLDKYIAFSCGILFELLKYLAKIPSKIAKVMSQEIQFLELFTRKSIQ